MSDDLELAEHPKGVARDATMRCTARVPEAGMICGWPDARPINDCFGDGSWTGAAVCAIHENADGRRAAQAGVRR